MNRQNYSFGSKFNSNLPILATGRNLNQTNHLKVYCNVMNFRLYHPMNIADTRFELIADRVNPPE